MAMPSSVAPLLCLSIFVFTAHASRPSAATGAATGPRQKALLAFQNLVKEGQALLVESQREIAECKDDEVKTCLSALDGNLKRYMEPLIKLAPAQSDAKFGEARDMLTAMLSIPSSSGAMCSAKAISANPTVNKIFKFEENLQATLNLMSAAQPAPPPPSEEEEDSKEEA